jgi:hypothetical protein
VKVLVSGSRDIDDNAVVYDAIINSPWEPSVLIHGDASGVDKIADRYARLHKIDTDVHPVPEWVWEKVGRKAGPMRNDYMVQQADALVAVWDGESSGTKDAMQQAESEGLPVYKVVCSETENGWEIERENLIEDDQMCLEDFE